MGPAVRTRFPKRHSASAGPLPQVRVVTAGEDSFLKKSFHFPRSFAESQDHAGAGLVDGLQMVGLQTLPIGAPLIGEVERSVRREALRFSGNQDQVGKASFLSQPLGRGR